jgi:hypothetical protein
MPEKFFHACHTTPEDNLAAMQRGERLLIHYDPTECPDAPPEREPDLTRLMLRHLDSALKGYDHWISCPAYQRPMDYDRCTCWQRDVFEVMQILHGNPPNAPGALPVPEGAPRCSHGVRLVALRCNACTLDDLFRASDAPHASIGERTGRLASAVGALPEPWAVERIQAELPYLLELIDTAGARGAPEGDDR